MMEEGHRRPGWEPARRPFRLMFTFTAVAEDIEALADVEMAVVKFAEGAGLLSEDLHTASMSVEEVLPGSPLDDHLRGHCEACGNRLLVFRSPQ